MITKTTKTILFAAIIAAMILPFSSMDYANADKKNQDEVYDGTQVKEAFILLDPYMTVTEERQITFDKKAAKEAGLSKKVIKFGKEYSELQNDMIKKVKKGDNVKLDKEKSKKFDKFFNKVKEGNTSFSLQSLIPVAYAANCNYWGPHNQPDAVAGTASFTPITNYLVYLGYHQVQKPYSGDPSIDYAKDVTAFGCDDGVFREQAIIRSALTYDTYNPEPNPEVFSYDWPAWWWGPYVLAWHGLN